MILPLHPQPMVDEILSSWMVRLAFANRYPLHTFYNKLLGYKKNIWNQDVDRQPDIRLLELLAHNTGQSVSALQKLTLRYYDGLFQGHFPKIGDAPWFTSVGLYHRTRTRPGMQFCPQCLKDGPVPYYRKHWRLILHAICEKHQCVLVDRCPSCDESIAYHRHGVGRDKKLPEVGSLYFCSKCDFDLRLTPLISIPSFDDHSLNNLCLTLNQYEQGYWDCGPLTPPCSIPFFQGVRALMSIIIGRHGYQLRKVIYNTLGVEITNSKNEGPERLPSIERANILLIIFWLLDDWPNRFIKLCQEAKFTRSRFAERISDLPFWLADIANIYFDNRIYLSNIEEVISAGKYLLKSNIEVNRTNLRNIMGLNPNASIQALNLWKNRI